MEKKELKQSVLKAIPIDLPARDIKGTGTQQVSKHFDIVLAADVHWTIVPPSPTMWPLPHPFVGMIFDPMDYIVCSIPVPSFLQDWFDAPPSIPLGGTVMINHEHKATTTTSVIGVAVFNKHVTDLPAYKIANPVGAPHDGEVYWGSETVFAQDAELSGDETQHVLTCWCPPWGMTPLPIAPEKLSKNPLRYFAFYNDVLSGYIQLPDGDPVIVGGVFKPHKYSIGEYVSRFAAMGIMKGATKAMKFFNNNVLRTALGKQNPLSKALCFMGFDPINLVTGGLTFEWDDFEIGGNTPIKWSNTYYSDYNLPMGSFGHKNYNNYDLMIIPDLENNAAAWINPDQNIAMSIPWIEVGEQEQYYRMYKIWYHRPNEKSWIVRQNLNTYYYTKFVHPTEGELYKCTKIEYNDGTVFNFSYQGQNKLLYKIEANDGRAVICEADRDIKQIEKVYYQKGKLLELQVSYTYDKTGNITHVWDQKNKAIQFDYNSNDLIEKRTNRNGMEYVFQYDNKNRVVYTSGIDKFQQAKIVYHPEQGYNEVFYSASESKSEQYHYDKNNLVYKKIDALGGETWYDYTANNERQLISTPEGKTLGYKFDKQGNIVEMIMPDGQSHKYIYNQDGQLTHRIDARGNIEYWEYDSVKRMTLYINPLKQDLRYKYQDESRLPNQVYKENKLLAEYTYNKANQLILLKGEHTAQQWSYDAYGRLVSYCPKESISLKLERDSLGRVAQMSQTNSRDIHINYDAYDLPIAITDGQLQMHLDYTPMGSVKRQWSYTTKDKKNIRELRYGYDSYENLLSIVNEKNEHYQFIRNNRDEVIEEVEFDGTHKKYIRDADGQVTEFIDNRGRVVYYQYDIAGRLAHTDYGNNEYEAYYYDENGLLIEAENQHSSVSYTRNGLGQVTQEKQGEVIIDYKYNDKGQLIGVGSSLGADVSYGYNNYGELTQVGAFNANQGVEADRSWQAILRYTKEGKLSGQEFTGGVQSEFEYDHLGRVTSQKVQISKRKQLDKTYVWNSEDKLVSVINELIGRRIAYQYDEFGGLSAMSDEQGRVQYKSPDKVGNIYESKSQKDRIYDKGGKLLRDKDWYYHYDKQGNLSLKTKRKLFEQEKPKSKEKPRGIILPPLQFKSPFLEEWADSSIALTEDNSALVTGAIQWIRGDWEYNWTANGMLRSVLSPDKVYVQFEYDALGRRTAKIVGDTIYRYIWDGDVLLHEWHYKLSDRPSLVVNERGDLAYDREEPTDNLVTWVYSQSYTPIAKIVDDKRYSVISDYLGTPTQMYDERGVLVWNCTLDIYGRAQLKLGSKTDCPFRWQGQYEDIELGGLYYNRFRYYDSTTGLYISKDPIELHGGMNFYSYVKDVNIYVDIFGLKEGEINVGDAGHHAPSVRKSLGRTFEVKRSDKTRPTFHFRGENPAADHWKLHNAERDFVGPRQGSFPGTDLELFDAYKAAYKNLDEIKVDVRSPDGKHLLGTDVTPHEGIILIEKWLKEQGKLDYK